MGKLITLEGGEGVGKTTQTFLLAEFLKKKGIEVEVFREPGGTKETEEVRSLWKRYASKWDSLSEALLLFATRRELLLKGILPALKNNKWVLCDRFYDSTLVYQGILKGADVEKLMQIKRMIMGDFEPDLTIILDLDPKKSCERVAIRNDENLKDYYDSLQITAHEKLREGFKKIADVFSFRTELVNAKGPIEIVAEKVKNIVIKRFNI